MAAEPGHGGVSEYYKSYCHGYNGASRAPLHNAEEKSSRRLVGFLIKHKTNFLFSLLFFYRFLNINIKNNNRKTHGALYDSLSLFIFILYLF